MINEWMIGRWKSSEKIDGMEFWLTIREDDRSHLVLAHEGGAREVDIQGILRLPRNEEGTWNFRWEDATIKAKSEYADLTIWRKMPDRKLLTMELPNGRRFDMIKVS